MSRRIRQVLVNGATFGIVYRRSLVEEGDVCDGVLRYDAREIDLRANMHPDAELETLWHEVIHAAMYQTGYDSEEQDEHLIPMLAKTIVQVLKDNPRMRQPRD